MSSNDALRTDLPQVQHAPPGDETATASSDGKTVGALLGEVTTDLSTLMRQEIELAKAEMKQEAAKTGKAAGMLGGAGFAAYMVALFASITVWWALANVMDEAWAALLVTAAWAVVAAVLAVVGKNKIKEINPKPERTVETLKEVPDALKGR
jgi:uncharacterized membrane protein YqjE